MSKYVWLYSRNVYLFLSLPLEFSRLILPRILRPTWGIWPSRCQFPKESRPRLAGVWKGSDLQQSKLTLETWFGPTLNWLWIQRFREQLWGTTLQSWMNTKLSLHRFWPCHENGLIKTIQTIPHNLYVSFKSASLYCGLRIILVYPNPQ